MWQQVVIINSVVSV